MFNILFFNSLCNTFVNCIPMFIGIRPFLSVIIINKIYITVIPVLIIKDKH